MKLDQKIENPVKIHSADAALKQFREWTLDRPFVLLGSATTLSRNRIRDRVREAGQRFYIGYYDGVLPNPTIASTEGAADRIREMKPELLVAVGGGSTLDTAKGVAALLSPSLSKQTAWLSKHLRQRLPFPADFDPLPILALPTTAGTGSEVTSFATIWDEVDRTKYSLTHHKLYPEAAVLVPEWTLSMPRELTLATGLDAFSHALETLWNRNRTPGSVSLAHRAVQALLQSLPRVLEYPLDLQARTRVQEAAVWAGLAISQNRTALAHSMSYPITGHLGVPHGLACSFTLGEVLRLNADLCPHELDDLCRAFGVGKPSDAIDRIYEFFESISLGASLLRVIPTLDHLQRLSGPLVQVARADNNLAPADEETARSLLRDAWKKVVGATKQELQDP